MRQQISRTDGEIKKILMDNGTLPEDKETREFTAAIKDLIQSIQQIDGRVEEMIKQEKTKLFIAIKQLRNGQKAMKGYSGKSTNHPRFIDRSG